MKSKPLAISYIRFSTPEQESGDSYRRQYSQIIEYCEKNDLQLADEAFYDRGVSAFTGANRKEGRLGDLINAIENGKIPKGSYLILESLDRFSREGVGDQMVNITRILARGIKIVTLMDNAIHSIEDYNQSQATLFLAITSMMRSNEDSALKSKRVRAAWGNKRDMARGHRKMVTRIMPAWLTEEGGKIVSVPEKEIIIKEIFELSKSGLGKRGIVKILNSRNEPVWGSPARNKSNLWNESYIQKILNNRAVLGEYQPHIKREGKRIPDGKAIPDYFPRIISDDDFFLALSKTKDRRGKGGRGAPKAANLFPSLSYCAHCGSKMTYQKKGEGEEYLRCRNALAGSPKCKVSGVNYIQIERLLGKALTSRQWEAIVGESSTLERNTRLLAAKSGELSALDEEVSKLWAVIKQAPGLPSLGEEFKTLEARRNKITQEIEILKGKVSEENSRLPRSYTNLLAASIGDLDVTQRRTLRAVFERDFEKLHFSRPPKGGVAVLGVLKSGKILILRSENNGDAPYQGIFMPWQLIKEQDCLSLQFSTVLDRDEIERAKPELVKIKKGADIVEEKLCKELSDALKKSNIIPAASTSVKALNEGVKKQYATSQDDFEAFFPSMRIIGETSDPILAMWGEPTSLRDLDDGVKRAESSFEKRYEV